MALLFMTHAGGGVMAGAPAGGIAAVFAAAGALDGLLAACDAHAEDDIGQLITIDVATVNENPGCSQLELGMKRPCV